MGTSNFYNHENGIFVLKTPSYDEVFKMEVERLLEDEDLFDTEYTTPIVRVGGFSD